MEKKFEISGELVGAITRYLVERPFKDVYQLIGPLNGLQEVRTGEPVEGSK